jgi:folate-binding protein YgfZ
MSELISDARANVLEWAVIEARGVESESFLQGQLSQDLTGVGEHGAFALLLAPDSVIITTCFVTRRDDGFDVVVPRELVADATTRLRRFLLRTKCTLTIHEMVEGPFATLDEQIDAAWPGPGEFAASLTPHSFGRSFVGATVSFQKGCFTGQELVARLDARGSSVPWRLVRVSGPSRERVDEVLKSKGPAGPQGVTSGRRRHDHFEGLGFAHRTLLSAPGDASRSDVTIEEVD